MTYYCVWPKDDDQGEAYWVSAASGEEARHLIALNVIEASDAEDAAKFECAPDNHKTPPQGFIHRRLNGPVAIKKRTADA